MNSIYQNLYKKNEIQSKRSDEAKKQCFVVWKDKRNQVFDAKRETLVCDKKVVHLKSNDKENEKPNKNLLIKWKNERSKKAAAQKKPPFVVGIVRHKIHSPPFLHKSKSVKSAEQKKKILRQSFAPKNYKFKPPEGLKVKVLKPISEKGTPFKFNSLFGTPKSITSRKKGLPYENITMRPRAKPLIDSNLKTTPKRTQINKDMVNQNCNAVGETLCTNEVEEPPIFGKLNILKFRENTAKAKANDIPKDAIMSDQPTFNQNINNSKSEGVSCQSTLTKVNSEEKECNFKLPTSYSCSQQIQNLLEQKDFRFTEFHSNSENNQVMKRTSEMPSPNLSRISFTATDLLKINDKIYTSKDKNIAENIDKERNNSVEDCGSLINDELNVTIYEAEDHLVDKEIVKYFNSSNTSTTPKNSNCESTLSDVGINEVDSNISQNYLLLSKMVDSPVKRISEENLLPEIENNKKKFTKLYSLNLDLESAEYKKESHLNAKELPLENVELSINSSKTLNENSLEIENNALSTSKNAIQESSFIIPTYFNVTEKNVVMADIQNEQELLKQAEATIENNVSIKSKASKNVSIKDGADFNVAEENTSKADVPNEFELSQCAETINSSKTLNENSLEIENTALSTSKNAIQESSLIVPTDFNIAEKNVIMADIQNEQELLKHAEATIENNAAPKNVSIKDSPDFNVAEENISNADVPNEFELLQCAETTINSSKIFNENSLEIENNVLSTSKDAIQDSSLIIPTDFNIAEKNVIMADIQNEQELLKHAEATIENNAAPKNVSIKDSPDFNVAEENMSKADVPHEFELLQCAEAAIKSNAATEKHGRKDDTALNVTEENMNKADIPNEHELLPCADTTVENNAIINKDESTLSVQNFKSNSTFELEELSPRNQNNTFNLKHKIISKTSLESDQKSKNVNEFSDDFVEHEKSATLLNQLSHAVTNYKSNDKMKKNESNKMQPEIIDISDSPLKEEKNICEKNPVLRRLYNNITKDLLSSSPESLNKSVKAELSSSRRVSEIVQLEDSLKVEKDLSTSVTVQDKYCYHNFKESQEKMSANNSQNIEIETVDLISDDEEDTQSYLSHIKARFHITTISSPKLNSGRKALTSIENIQSSPCKAQQSPIFLKENSPKTQNISIQVSFCKTQQSPLIDKRNSLIISEASPLRNKSLCGAKVDIALSPKKKKNTPRKASREKCNSSIVNSEKPKKLNEDVVASSSLKNTQVQTEENSSVLNSLKPELLEENSSTSSAVTSQIRILRNRKVDISPSPKKTRTPRKALLSKNQLPDVQTPNNNFNECNIDKVAVSPAENVRNSSCNTPRLQSQAKENTIPIKIIPCDTPRPKLLTKENSPVAASPIKILSLRSRKIDVSPSPKKTKNTPRKVLFAKKNLSDENDETPKNNLDELNENSTAMSMLENVQNITCSTPRLQEQAKANNIQLRMSPCEAVRPKLLGKEDSPVTNSVSSPMRILCLRGRKVDVTPSPKKKTPSRTPRKKKTPVK